ncbi:tRNA:m(4)X modification enzyme TRM13 [Grus japonensis]|uniref:tRNA:m(4)X modification enzyme TRM13 n=1 Tax=Grus japonensis TaxID=30415 RepID=A0ABC9Y2H1_GRUJA
MPASSKMDPPLAKAEPISDSGSASGITELRKVKKEGEEVLQAEIPLQPMEKTMVRQTVDLQPMEIHGGADIHLQPMEDPTPEQVDAQRRL